MALPTLLNSHSFRLQVRERAAEMELAGLEHTEPALSPAARRLARDMREGGGAASAAAAEAGAVLSSAAASAAPKPKPRTGGLLAKPAWAMTEVEADEMDDEEAVR